MDTKRGFLLMNTGSPDEPTEHAMREFLKAFITDDEADQPPLIRNLIRKTPLHPHSPGTMAKAYQSIWTKEGSPLVHHSILLVEGLQSRFDGPVECAMAYGRPHYKDAMEKLVLQDIDELCLLPMFPQYAISTFGLCIEEVKAELKKRYSGVVLRVAPPFYNHPVYLEALTEGFRDTDEHVVFSYHGYPNRHLKKAQQTAGDEHQHDHCMSSMTCCSECSAAHDTCYRFQCLKTSREAARAAHLPEGHYTSTFQSDHVHNDRMKPYTDETLLKLAGKGIKKVAVVCPSSYCDDLETLNDIDRHGKEVFMQAGGESFRTIPCLNHSESSLHCMEELMADAQHWPVE